MVFKNPLGHQLVGSGQKKDPPVLYLGTLESLNARRQEMSEPTFSYYTDAKGVVAFQGDRQGLEKLIKETGVSGAVCECSGGKYTAQLIVENKPY